MLLFMPLTGNLVPLKRLDKGLLKMAACIPDLEGRTLFHYAAATRKTHVSKYFMEQVKVDDVNMKDGQGNAELGILFSPKYAVDGIVKDALWQWALYRK
ncbi:uncharacterized protein LOC115970742 isoform X2 [Quercus lobata]|uniref:uncharacterized protein LOC115970742 isoform X2 n=1 Tax=Quercus lobata TaxID=97700 RepID=UPI0012462018|nr:uncharacterized protein LOC115970742 isoform X2 [Quercus lobata]